jgi:hypothetical protein
MHRQVTKSSKSVFPIRVPRNPKVVQNIVKVSAKNHRMCKNFKVPQKLPNSYRNIAGIFVRQLALLVQSPWSTNFFFVSWTVNISPNTGVSRNGKLF